MLNPPTFPTLPRPTLPYLHVRDRREEHLWHCGLDLLGKARLPRQRNEQLEELRPAPSGHVQRPDGIGRVWGANVEKGVAVSAWTWARGRAVSDEVPCPTSAVRKLAGACNQHIVE